MSDTLSSVGQDQQRMPPSLELIMSKQTGSIYNNRNEEATGAPNNHSLH